MTPRDDYRGSAGQPLQPAASNRPTYVLQGLILVLGALLATLGGFAIDDKDLATTFQGIGTGLIAAALVSLLLLVLTGDPFRMLLEQISRATGSLEERVGTLAITLKDSRQVGLERIWATRTDAERDSSDWKRLRQARRIDISAYAAEFLLQDDESGLAAALESGAKVRILLGNPEGTALLARDGEAPHRTGLPARVNASIEAVRRLSAQARGAAGTLELALYDAPLYCSTYRFDDQMFVTLAQFASSGASAPTLLLTAAAEDQERALFSSYAKCFDEIWSTATAVELG